MNQHPHFPSTHHKQFPTPQMTSQGVECLDVPKLQHIPKFTHPQFGSMWCVLKQTKIKKSKQKHSTRQHHLREAKKTEWQEKKMERWILFWRTWASGFHDKQLRNKRTSQRFQNNQTSWVCEHFPTNLHPHLWQHSQERNYNPSFLFIHMEAIPAPKECF